MANIVVNFRELMQDSQAFGSDDEHMVSRAFFTVDCDGTVTRDCFCAIKQMVGAPLAAENIEVARPQGYRGPFNHHAFQQHVAAYFLSLVGGNGSGIRISGGSNIRMRSNRFVKAEQIAFEGSDADGCW